ncbi:Multidrug export protein MepA [bioreactor metagenome]|uniref:Multidrug export protein MepA n=1 Tax=bioreactor metagenome TaxID=1076179 RepID=A0A644Z5U9_9ZZZZ
MAQVCDTNRQEERAALMLESPIPGLIFKLAYPTMISFVVTALYNLVDAYFVSSLGTAATGAVGVNFALDQVILMAGSFLAMGANSYIARLLGAGKTEKASQVLSTSLLSAFFTGSFVMVTGLVFLEPMVRLMGSPPSVVPYAMDYASYMLYAAPYMAANFVLNQCLRSEGSSLFSLMGMLAGAVLNTALDPLFIFVFGWGISGAAAATAISKLVTFLILITPYIRRKTLVAPALRKVRFTWDIISEVCRMGAPALFRMGLSVAATVLLNNLAGQYSDSALAAISVVSKVSMLINGIVMGYGQGFQPVVGFNWGAGRYDRVREAYRVASVSGICIISVLALIAGIFAPQIISIFTDADAEMIALGSLSLRSQCLVTPSLAWGVVVNMLFAGAGKARGSFLMSVSRQGIFLLPMLLVLPPLLGVQGVMLVQAGADLGTLLMIIFFHHQINRELNDRILLAQSDAGKAGKPC